MKHKYICWGCWDKMLVMGVEDLFSLAAVGNKKRGDSEE
jgi:hypothetical protein